MEIILASNSPRRNEILSRYGIPYRKLTAEAEEKNHATDETCSEVAVNNALEKAKAAAFSYSPETETLFIGADTIVVMEDEILPKPVDREDAEKMLIKLSGDTHSVITGVALVIRIPGKKEPKIFTSFEETFVTFRELSPEEIDLYISTGEPMDKAGAYGIQGYGAFLVEGIRGDYLNVVGLPLMRLFTLMRKADVNIYEEAVKAGKLSAEGESSSSPMIM